MGSQGDAGVHEVIADAAPNLPSPHGLTAPERAAPDRVSEVAFMILVHEANMRPDRRDCHPPASHGRSDRAFLCGSRRLKHGADVRFAFRDRRSQRRSSTSRSAKTAMKTRREVDRFFANIAGTSNSGSRRLVRHFRAFGHCDRSQRPMLPVAPCFCPAEVLYQRIDIWPDNWAASPRTARRTFQTLTKFDQPGTGRVKRAPDPTCAPSVKGYYS